MFELSPIQCDALMETFNIGVGRASRALSQLMGCEIAMSVPVIVQASVAEADAIVDPSLKGNQDACMVSSRLGGIEAEAVMIFQGPRDNIKNLMNLPLKSHAPGGDDRQTVASKVASMVIDSCAAQIEDLVGMMEISREPVVFKSTISNEVFFSRDREKDVLIIVKIDISLKKRGVTGHLLLSFTEKSAGLLAEGLDKLLSDSET